MGANRAGGLFPPVKALAASASPGAAPKNEINNRHHKPRRKGTRNVAVRIRMKKMGRRHRPFFRICAMDARTPRDSRAIEELGTYDPMVRNKDERVSLNAERVRHWLSVGAQPSEKVAVIIKKYLTEGGSESSEAQSEPSDAGESAES